MLHIHLGALHGVGHHIGCVVRAVAAYCRCPKPVKLLGGHERELAAPVQGDLHRFALGFVPEAAELALEFKGGHGRHNSLLNQRIPAKIYV